MERSSSRSPSNSPRREDRHGKRRYSSHRSHKNIQNKESRKRNADRDDKFGDKNRSRKGDHDSNHDTYSKYTSKKKARDFSNLMNDAVGPKYTWGKKEEEEKEEKVKGPVEKPNFGLSGALAKDKETGNTYRGVVLKFTEPAEARPPTRRWRLYVFKNDKNIETLHIHRQSAFLVGRDKNIADILTEHASCSKQHAVLQFRMIQMEDEDGSLTKQVIRPYIMDLRSTNSTYLNGKRIDDSRYYELRAKDMLKFGESTREYVLMDAGAI